MISRIRGALLRREVDAVELMTGGGVGYRIEIPASVFERLPRPGEELELLTHQVFREDGVVLYGFLDDRERTVFARLLAAQGVGPRLALGMVSAFTPERLVRAITERDVAILRQIPGVGAKKAEKLVVELAGKLDDLALAAAGPRPESRAAEEALAALLALGYSPAESTAAIRRALEEKPELHGVDLIRSSLAALGA